MRIQRYLARASRKNPTARETMETGTRLGTQGFYVGRDLYGCELFCQDSNSKRGHVRLVLTVAEMDELRDWLNAMRPAEDSLLADSAVALERLADSYAIVRFPEGETVESKAEPDSVLNRARATLSRIVARLDKRHPMGWGKLSGRGDPSP
jgi:hypothetical protein